MPRRPKEALKKARESPHFDFWCLGAIAYDCIVDNRALSLEQQRIVALAQHMRANGCSVRQIVAELRGLGVVNRRGRPWSLSGVFQIVRKIPRRDLGAPSPAGGLEAVRPVAEAAGTVDGDRESYEELPFTD
jgi:hypothetical protein